MRLAILPLGTGAEDYIPHALAVYRKGRRGSVVVDDGLIMIGDRYSKIFTFPECSALFQHNPSGVGYSPLFSETVPTTYPTFRTPMPAMGGFFPSASDTLLVPDTAQVQAYNLTGATRGASMAFQNAITPTHGEALMWNQFRSVYNADSGYSWYLTTYRLTGYVNPYDNPLRSKQLITDGITSLWESDLVAAEPDLVVGFQIALPSIQYRRLRDTTTDTYTMARGGQLFKISEASVTLDVSVPLALSTLPAPSVTPVTPGGSGLGTYAVHTAWMYDIFTSERATHYYVIKFCSSVATGYWNGTMGYQDDIRYFPGMSLSVEKRAKADFSLVATYNLTPARVDRVLQGITPLAQCDRLLNTPVAHGMLDIGNFNWGAYDPATDGDALTRFSPIGGGVLVAADGTEYPLLAVMSGTQDLFPTQGDVSVHNARATYRANYIADPSYTASGLDASWIAYYYPNTLQQPALLWLGTPPGGFDCYTWPGVDAAGIKTAPFGSAAKFGTNPIADSDGMLTLLEPFISTDPQQLVATKLVSGVPTAQVIQTQPTSQPFVMFDI